MALNDLSGGGRGQIVIVVALVLAVVLVTLALVLNSGIFVENLSARETSDSDDVALAVETAFERSAATMRAANRADEATPEAAGERFASDLETVTEAVARERALRGQAFEVRLVDQTNGSSLQQNQRRSYTNTAGDGNWTVAEDVDRMAGFRLSVERDSLYQDPGTVGVARNQTFHVDLDDVDTTWRIHVFEQDAQVTVLGGEASVVEDLDAEQDIRDEVGDECRAETATAEIDLVEGTVDGRECPALSFAETLSDDLTVSYHNADDLDGASRSGGTYRVLVPETAVVDEASFDDPGQGAPFESGAVFAATIRVHYDRDDVHYERQRTVYAEPLAYEADE